MSTRNTAILILIVTVTVFALTRYCFPRIEEKIVTVEKEVIKEVAVTTTHEVKQPDGTVTTDTTTTDTKQSTDTKSTTVAKYATADWFVAAGMGYSLDLTVHYNVQVNRRILGPVFVGVQGSTDKTVGVQVGIQF